MQTVKMSKTSSAVVPFQLLTLKNFFNMAVAAKNAETSDAQGGTFEMMISQSTLASFSTPF